MRRLVALIASGCLAGAGVATLAGPVSAAPQPRQGTATAVATVDWGPCDDPRLVQAGGECGYVDVPLDYRHPGGTQIQLAVSRIAHSVPDSEYQGVMLVNPGGPGGSGLSLSRLGAYVPQGAGDAYDWIGFDPRGVGSSKPALSCIPDYFHGDRPPYVPTTGRLEKTWLKRSHAYANACKQDQPKLLSHMRTTDAARDMDMIRRALGAEQINYYGFSYGTYLAQVYATMFPDHVRRMVLDSNVDPRDVFYQANLNQDVAFEKSVRVWFEWLAKYDDVYHLGTTWQEVQHEYYAQLHALDAHAAGGVVGGDEWNDIMLYGGYYQVVWTDLADVFSSWVNDHDTDKLVAAFEDYVGPGDDNGFAVYAAVECTDAPWPKQWSTWRADNWRVHREAPFVTWGNAWFNAPCKYWHAKAGERVDVDGHDVPALLVDETLDAATPYEGSLEVRRRFPESSLIAEPGGTTHAGTLYGNACVDDQIAAYLADGTLPPRQPGDGADTYCDPLPQPVPAGAAQASSTKSAAAARTQTASPTAAPSGREVRPVGLVPLVAR